MGYHFDWGVVFTRDALTALRIGIEYTLLVSAISLALGSFVGLFAAVVRIWGKPPFSQIAYVYVDFFRTTPALVQLIWVFYVLPIVLGIGLSAVTSGVIALSLNAGAFLSEIFRAGLQSISQGQWDAATVLGLSRFQAFRHVILPQAIRRVLPAIGNIFISLLKESSLLSVVAVPELTYQMQTAVARTFRPLELYTAAAVIYFALTYPLSLAISAIERKFRVT